MMPSKLIIRTDISLEILRRRARLERDGRVAARLLAIANALDGMSRAEAARAAGMDRQTLRDWVIRFNAAGIDGLCDRKRSGPKPFLDEGQQAVLRAMVLRGPDPDHDGVSAWRLIDICRLCKERFGVAYSVSGMFDLLKGLDLSWQKSRPRHPQADAAAQKAFKKGGSPKL
jgi:transposase